MRFQHRFQIISTCTDPLKHALSTRLLTGFNLHRPTLAVAVGVAATVVYRRKLN